MSTKRIARAFAYSVLLSLVPTTWSLATTDNCGNPAGLTLQPVKPSASYTYLETQKDGEVVQVSAPMTEESGGRWVAKKLIGENGVDGQAESVFEFKLVGSAVVAELHHSIKSSDPHVQTDTNGSAEFGVQLTGGENLPTSATVLVDIYRTIIPVGGITGYGEIEGQKRVEVYERPWMQREQHVYNLNVEDFVPVPALSGNMEVTGQGEVYATSTVVVSVVAAPANTVPVPGLEECDDPDDDETDPDEDCGSNNDKGDALHLRLTTGDVWTRVPAFTTYADDAEELDFELRYDTLRAYEDGPLGYGWTHNHNLTLSQVASADGSKLVFRWRNGRRNAFKTTDGVNYISPPGRGMICAWPVGLGPLVLQPNGDVYAFDTSLRLVNITDRRGRITRFSYTNGRLSQVISPHGRTIGFEYYPTSPSRLWKVTDPNLKVTTFEYDASGNLTRITDPLNHAVQYEYDGLHRVTKETLKNGKFYTAAYDNGSPRILDSVGAIVAKVSGNTFPQWNYSTIAAGNVTYTDGRGKQWTIQRDRIGRLLKVTSPNNGPNRQFTWGAPDAGADRNRLVKTIDQLGHETTTKWDVYGNVLERKDAELNLEKFEYQHPWFRDLVTKRTEPDDDVWQYEYDLNNGDLLKIIDPIVEGTQPEEDRVIRFAYEPHPAGTNPPLPGRIKKITQTDRNSHQTIREYDLTGNLATLTRGAGDLNLVTTYQYDAMGRQRFETVQRGDKPITTERTYDDMGRLLDTIEDSTENGLQLKTTRVYDEHGNLMDVINPRGFKTSYQYDHRNRMTRETVDSASGGLAITSQWVPDGNGNIVQYLDANNHVTDYDYNDQNFLTESRDAKGYRTVFTRDIAGRLQRLDRAITPGAGSTNFRSVAFGYDTINRLTSQTLAPDTLGLATLYEYNGPSGCSCNPATPGRALPHKITDPKGKVTYLNYDHLDRLTSVVRKVGSQSGDPLGDGDDAVTRYEYDPVGNLTWINGPEGEATRFEYDAANRRMSKTVFDDYHGPQITYFTHDGSDNVSQITLPNGNVVALTYDGADRLKAADDQLGSIVSYEYDKNGNVVKRFDGLAHFWEYKFDAADRMTEAHDPIVEAPDKFMQYAYDGVGNLVRVTNNRGIVTKYNYDEIDRLIEKIEDSRDPPNPAIPTDNTRTTYGYDGINQTSITDHDGNATSYEYDDALRLKKITYPSPGGVIDYDYDAAGNLFSRHDQRNIWTYYDYDDLHHLTHRYYPTRTEDFAFDRSDRLRQAKNDVVDATFAYDDAGRIDTAAQQYLIDPATYTVGYDYVVAADDVRRITHYPAGRDVTHRLDQRFRLASVADGEGVGTTWTHDLANRRKDATLGNGLFTSFEYDLNDRLTKIRHARDASTLFDIDYGYDEVGNRLWTRYNAANDNNNLTDRSETYAYDNRDRLVAMSRGTMAAGSRTIQTPIDHNVLPSSQQWTNLDRRGNWREFAELFGSSPTGVTQTRSVNAVNQYTAISLNGQPVTPALQHDAAGNLTLDPLAWNFWAGPSGLKYEYDEENRLTRVRIAVNDAPLLEIGYDAVGRRVETVEYWDAQEGPLELPRHTRHVYDGLQTVEEYECGTGVPACGSGWSLAREFLWGGRFPEPIAMVDHTAAGLLPANQPEVLHYLDDVLGSVIGLTNSAGTLVERYTYDPYGKTLVERRDPLTGSYELNGADGNFPTWSAFGNPFMWTAQRYDGTVGLYHFKYRTYNPIWGRWNQQDPLGYVDGVNVYALVADNPISWVDLFGLIKRGPDGKVIVTPNGPPEEVEHPSGPRARMEPVTVEADDGTKINGLRLVEGDSGFKTDCHGQTFCDGDIWINNDQVEKILKGDAYQKVDNPQVGDVVIYRDKDGVVHSVVVVEVDPKTGKVTKVRSEGGLETGTRDLPPGPGEGTAWRDKNAKKEYWRKPKPKDKPTTQPKDKPTTQPKDTTTKPDDTTTKPGPCSQSS